MMFGLKESVIERIRAVFAKFPAIQRAVIYGSRAKGNYKRGSDIDLTLYGEELTPDVLGLVNRELDDLLLPWMIDLSIFEHIEHVKLREHIERVGVVFYEGEGFTRRPKITAKYKDANKKTTWPRKTLGEVCQFRGGGTPSKTIERYWRGDIPWISPKDMKLDIVSDSIDHISREAIDSSATSLIPKDSVLMVVRSGILARIVPIARTGCVLTINQDLKALCPNGTIDSRFLYYLLNSKMDTLLSMVSRGATVHRLMTDQIRSLDFMLPPLPEQQRIVAILDEAFAGIATAKANAEKNLRNARDLFENYTNLLFSQKQEGWIEKPLEHAVAADCSLSYGIVQPGDEHPNGLPVVRPTDLTTRTICLDGLKRIDPKLSDNYKRTTLQGGELLLCVRGSTGTLAKAAPELIGGNVTRGIVPIRFNHALIIQDFGYYLMRSEAIQGQIREKTYGAALMQINIRDLRNILLSFPSLKTQREMVSKFDILSVDINRLEIIYQCKLAALKELKKSLLHDAFRGAL